MKQQLCSKNEEMYSKTVMLELRPSIYSLIFDIILSVCMLFFAVNNEQVNLCFLFFGATVFGFFISRFLLRNDIDKILKSHSVKDIKENVHKSQL